MTHTLITTGKLLASSLIIAMAFSSTAMAQAKSSTSTPQADVGDTIKPANTYGQTRSNRSQGIAAPSGETPDVVGVTERANINTSRSNKLNNTIAAPTGETPDVGDLLPNATSYGSTRSNKSMPGIIAPKPDEPNLGPAVPLMAKTNLTTRSAAKLRVKRVPLDRDALLSGLQSGGYIIYLTEARLYQGAHV